jgi:hypothetical protein
MPVLALALAACSGGSSGTSTGASPDPLGTSNGPTTGKVTVLLTDGPGTDWDQAIATITSIELLGDHGKQQIFDGSSTVDLLALPDYFDVFSIADDITPDTFQKIRIFVETLELVELDDEGNELQRIAAQLVGGGKIDLNPRESFVIGPGDSLYIELDFDMNKAFKTTTTGNGRVIVRPVVMVKITREPSAGRLTRLRGTVAEIDADGPGFLLCQNELVSAMHDDDDDDEDHDDDDGGDDSDGDDRHCIRVTTDEMTGIFAADGQPVGFDALAVNDLVTAIGHLRRDEYDDEHGDDEDGDEDENDESDASSNRRGERDVVLHAVTVEIGEDFRRVSGVAETIVEDDMFDLGLEPGQNIGTDETVLPTRLYPQTRIFGKDGAELGSDAIVPGVDVLADGVLVSADGMSDSLRAALLILDLHMRPEEEVLRGEIVSLNFDAGTLQLLVGDVEHCVNANDADIFLVSNADGFYSERVDLGDLEPMQWADAFGEGEDVAGCFIATDILASALPGNVLPMAEAGEDQAVTAGTSVMLNGSASRDDDGDSLAYAWQLVAVPEGSTAELAAADTAMPSFIADVAGEYVIELVVNDGREDSAPDTVVVTAE